MNSTLNLRQSQSTENDQSIISLSNQNIPFISNYKQTINQYSDFLRFFQDKINNIYQKQTYRIYLNDKANEKAYNQLLNQKNKLIKTLQESKDYTQSVNRRLIEEIMRLQRMKSQYEQANNQIIKKITEGRQSILRKKKQLRDLQKRIKSYWVYNYDISLMKQSSVRNQQQNSSIMSVNTDNDNNDTNISILNNSELQIKKQKINPIRLDIDRQRMKKKQILKLKLQTEKTGSKISVHDDQQQNRLILPSIIHNRPLVKKTSESLFGFKQIIRFDKQNVLNKSDDRISILTKNISLMNLSVTKDKMINKIQEEKKRRLKERTQYEREKLNLMKLLMIYLKKQANNKQEHSQRIKLDKTVMLIQQKINFKAKKLSQIEQILSY